MFQRVEIRFEIVEIRLERKGDHMAPISAGGTLFYS